MLFYQGFVTRDKKDFLKPQTKEKYPLKIVSPSEFLEIVLPEILKDI